MRVGFVVECHRDGADHKVIEHLVGRLRKDVKAYFVFSGSKRALFENCGAQVEKLFEVERCERVFVVWDLMPCDARFQDKGKPCCAKEREHLLGAIRSKDHARTVLLCVTHELEAWLLCDGAALTAVLDNPNHRIKPIQDDKKPEAHPNPKKVLNKHFNEHLHRDYNDAVHALKIIERVNVSKLKRAPSFARLRQKLEAL